MNAPEHQPVRLDWAQKTAWLRLIRTENVGPVTFRQLVNRFGSAEAALEELPVLGARGGARSLRIPSQTEAEDEFDRLERMGGRLIALSEPEYPPLLRFVHGPPPLLSVIGGTDLNLEKCVSIVGARNASAAGRRAARTFAADLGREGYVVVSGLARGIDTAAHQGALETGTVAVFAGGVDHIYPFENMELAQQIINAGGLILSEMPLSTEPRARDFPRRNRIVAGMSGGTLVVEAAKRSGSLITARLALEADREVFAVPGSPLDPRAEGGNQLIRQGATLVTSVQDIIEELVQMRPPQARLFEDEPEFPSHHEGEQQPAQDDRERVLEALSVTPTGVDDLIEATGVTAPALQIILLELDLAGRIERTAGQLVALR